MIGVVVDTNVLASGFANIHPRAAPVLLLEAWRSARFRMVISHAILDELVRTLSNPYFGKKLSAAEREEVLRLLRRRTLPIVVTVTVTGVATHPEDDLVLSTAASANADYLVTGDAGLLAIRWYGNTQIVSPREFLDILNAAST